MTESPNAQDPGLPPVRTVADVAVIKALADPTRLAILTALMQGPGRLPVMSVKELAEALGEPQTKLYRHVRQLEAAGLVKVAATRVVSGILEQRYQAAQRDLTFAPDFLREHPDETRSAATAVFDQFKDGLLEALERSDDSNRPDVFVVSNARLTRKHAAEVKAKLKDVQRYFEADSDDSDAIEVNLLMGMYTTPED
jgi:DNA-binding transcriptional ArsR family regulator